jgi:3-methyladenine DNA glycosylase/8-oxoguanine DNA glycosylase
MIYDNVIKKLSYPAIQASLLTEPLNLNVMCLITNKPASNYVMNKQDIEKGMKALIDVDSDITRICQAKDAPPLRIKENSFKSLLSIIISQQISTNAASTIMAKN